MASKRTGMYLGSVFAKPTVFAVSKENTDGTVNLEKENGGQVIVKIPVSDAPKPGHFTYAVLPEEIKQETVVTPAVAKKL